MKLIIIEKIKKIWKDLFNKNLLDTPKSAINVTEKNSNQFLQKESQNDTFITNLKVPITNINYTPTIEHIAKDSEKGKVITFYHGGVAPNFTIEDLDIYKLAHKQQKKNRDYAGFYMVSENDKSKAIHYAHQTNILNKTNNRGILKLDLSADLNIYHFDHIGAIDRLSRDTLIDFTNQGYDLLEGKSFDCQQYVLLNKNKIIALQFEKLPHLYEKKER